MSEDKVIINIKDYDEYRKLSDDWDKTKEALEEKLKNTIYVVDKSAYKVLDDWHFHSSYIHQGKDEAIAELTRRLNESNRIIEDLKSKSKKTSFWKRLLKDD